MKQADSSMPNLLKELTFLINKQNTEIKLLKNICGWILFLLICMIIGVCSNYLINIG